MSEQKVQRYWVTADGLLAEQDEPEDDDVVMASDFERLEAELKQFQQDVGDSTNVTVLRELKARIAALSALLQEIRPHTDALICYASTVSEHPLNDLGKRIDAALAAFAAPTQVKEGQ